MYMADALADKRFGIFDLVALVTRTSPSAAEAAAEVRGSARVPSSRRQGDIAASLAPAAPDRPLAAVVVVVIVVIVVAFPRRRRRWSGSQETRLSSPRWVLHL